MPTTDQPDPLAAHTAVLAALDRETAEAESVTALAGRRRILERHAPTGVTAVFYRSDRPPFTTHVMDPLAMAPGQPTRPATICNACRPPGALDLTACLWPCDDYRDAAADLLPQEKT